MFFCRLEDVSTLVIKETLDFAQLTRDIMGNFTFNSLYYFSSWLVLYNTEDNVEIKYWEVVND